MLAWILLSASCKAQQPSKDKFHLTFGSCFKSTNVDLKFNNIVQFKAIELTSDFSTGVVLNKNIVFDGKSLKYILSSREVNRRPLKLANNQILLEITSNGVTNTFKIELKKGAYILLDKCGTSKTFEIKQYKKPPVIE